MGFQQRSASCDKLTGGLASFVDEYEQLKAQFINGPFSETQVNTLLEGWTQQIREATIEASSIHQDALSMADWENAIVDLKAQLEFARTH